MFHDVSKIVLYGRRNTFATCSENVLHFSGQAQHFGDLRCHFAWQRSMSWCVFFANGIVSAARSDDKVQIPWQAWHFVTCDENRRRSVRKKTRRKTSILKLRSVKCKDILHEMLVLMLQHVSSRLSGFFGAVAVSIGEAGKLSLLKVSRQVVMSFCVAGVALRDIPQCFKRHFGDLHRHFAWLAQHFRRVASRLLCEWLCQRCAKW